MTAAPRPAGKALCKVMVMAKLRNTARRALFRKLPPAAARLESSRSRRLYSRGSATVALERSRGCDPATLHRPHPSPHAAPRPPRPARRALPPTAARVRHRSPSILKAYRRPPASSHSDIVTVGRFSTGRRSCVHLSTIRKGEFHFLHYLFLISCFIDSPTGLFVFGLRFPVKSTLVRWNSHD